MWSRAYEMSVFMRIRLMQGRLYNGGGPGVMYGFIAAVFFYSTIAACLAELASAIPSSANVYHWASVTAGRYGKVVSFYAGWWYALGWKNAGPDRNWTDDIT